MIASKNWLPTLIEHPKEFYLILSRYINIIKEDGDTLEGLYEYLAAGDRFQKFTVYDFALTSNNEDGTKIFYFDEGDFGFLSGTGSSGWYTVGYGDDGEPVLVDYKLEAGMMS